MQRFLTKIAKIWFRFFYGQKFKKLGTSTFIFSPFRLDGIKNIMLGSKTLLQSGTWLYCEEIDGITASLTIGNECTFGYNNHITAVRDVSIGNQVLTANNVYISDNLHGYEDITTPVMHQPVKFKKAVSIGDGSWIGENVCIIGASVGKNCVIGANAVVTKDIPDYCVAVGAPAVVIRYYDLQINQWVDGKPN